MKPEWRRYAPIGIYVAILAALAAGILYFLRRDFDIYLQLSLAAVVIGLAVFVLLDPDKTREVFSGRQARYGSNALVILIAGLGIVVVINYLAYTYNQRWDLTEGRTNSLSDSTIAVLQSLPGPVSVRAFYEQRTDSTSAVEILEQFREASNGNFDYEIVDPEVDPFAANAAGVTQSRQLALSMGDNQEVIDFPSEVQITEALVRLMSGERHVYFLIGHGEASISGQDGRAMAQLAGILESRNYSVREVNLLSGNTMPDDADLLVIAGPQVPLAESEIKLIDEFLQSGGAAVFMEDPTLFLEGLDGESDTLAAYLEEAWGITLVDDLVLDYSGGNQSISVTYAYGFTQHPIVETLAAVPAFPIARSVEVSDEVAGISQQPIVFSDPNAAYGETDFEALLDESGNAPFEPDEETELIGPALMVVAESFDTNARIVVIGDSDFARDDNFAFQSNGNLLVNAIDWASEQENLIDLNPNTPTARFLPPPQPTVLRTIQFFSICLIPGSMIVAGIVVWWRRRQRG